MSNEQTLQLSIARATLSLVDQLAYLSPMTKAEAREVVNNFQSAMLVCGTSTGDTL